MAKYSSDYTGAQVDAAVAAALAPAMEHIETQTASASAQLDFTGFDSTKYVGYEFVIENLVPATDNAHLYLRMSNDGGSSFKSGASDYRHQRIYGFTTPTGGNTTDSKIDFFNGGDAESGFGGTLKILGPHTSGSKTRISFHGVFVNNSDEFYQLLVLGEVLTAEDNDAARFVMGTGNIASGTIRMYGLRG